MSAEAQAWSKEPFAADDAHLREAACGPTRAPVRLPTRAPARRPEARASGRAESWNVLTEQLVSFPRPGRHASFEDLAGVQRRVETARGDRDDTTRSQSYGEAWLARELLAIRYLADSGYPSLDRQGSASSRATTMPGLPATNRQVDYAAASAAGHRPRDTRLKAMPSRHIAVKPRGLRRLLPGVATLAVLAGIWAGAGMLSSTQARPLTVLSGSVKAPGGYSYIVRPGDTLWSIASRLQPSGDPRALVARLESQLHGATLVPGSRLTVP